MLSALYNQKIAKRKPTRLHNRNRFISLEKFTKIPNKRRKKPRFQAKTLIKLPLIGGIFLLLIFIIISSPLIFPLSFTTPNTKVIKLPVESNLNNFAFKSIKQLGNKPEVKLITIDKHEKTVLPKSVSYTIKKGDTIYSISKAYNISLFSLLRENKIKDPTGLRIGDVIKLPDEKNNISIKNNQKNQDSSGIHLPVELKIISKSKEGYIPFNTQFILSNTIEDDGISYMWNMGNDRYRFEKNPAYTYTKPGNYNVFLIISDKMGREVISNTINIKVSKQHRKKVNITSTSPKFITLGQVNDILKLSELLEKKNMSSQNDHNSELSKGDLEIFQSKKLLQRIGDDQLLTVAAGYSELTIHSGKNKHTVYLFVSPFPSKHSYEPDYNWYKTQFATGISGNCGPACVAMAIYWARSDNIPVAKVRSEIGFPYKSGAINFNHMFYSFRKHKVRATFSYLKNKTDLYRIVDRGNIAIIVFKTNLITKVRGDKKENLVGRYYDDATGHYCIVKGYTLDKKYFIIYDPIPSDWVENSERYKDGVSMIGKNRYYSAQELFKAMEKRVIEISR